MKNIDLISYGSISKDFKIMAQLTKYLNSAKSGNITQKRTDCYSTENLTQGIQIAIRGKFDHIEIKAPLTSELFLPSKNYPSHKDEGGISYFIPLEDGLFLIENVHYPVVPFVLYAFEDSKLHNTDFGAIMLK